MTTSLLNRFKHHFVLALAAMLLVSAPASAGTAGTSESQAAATQFLETFGAKAIATLGDQAITPTQREAQFRQLLSEGFALKTIGRFVMGKHWKRATAEEKQDFARLFEDFVVRSYLNKLSNYSGEKLAVGRARTNESKGLAAVSSKIQRSSGSPIAVEWRLHAKDGHWRIYDVVVEGVSMALAQRSEFDAVIRSSGGQIQGLLDRLRAMNRA